MAGSANNIAISPVNIFWRIEANHQVKMVADVADSLDGKYFTLMGTHYVWFDGVAAADPAPVGLTAIPIAYTTGDTAATLAGLVQVAVDALGDFSATVSTDTVDIIAAAVGEVTDSADVDAGVTVTICIKGKDFDLGLLEGDNVLANAPSTFPVKSHQTGLVTLADINLGPETNELPTILQETTKSNLDILYKVWGGTFTPSGGTQVSGIGTGQIGKNMLVEAARLVMSPVNTLSSELSYDVTLMLAVPIPDSLKFSGETQRTLSVTWRGYPNLNLINADTNTVIIGDSEQTGL